MLNTAPNHEVVMGSAGITANSP